MQSMLSCVFFIAFFAYTAVAQKKGAIPAPIELLPAKSQPTTAPQLIDESLHKKACPAGFNFVGKQCAKTLTAQPDTLCPVGTVKIDGKCVKYIGKESQCPSGFTFVDGACILQEKAETFPVCPPGFELIGDKCIKKIALPELSECPSGSLPKGDSCVKGILESPNYVCPSGYLLVGKKCQRESTFDCTPIRRPTQAPEEKKGEVVHLRSPGKGKEANIYHLPASAPLVEEYVIQETCKRIITEDARAICPELGTFNGKMCERDVIVPQISRPGGFRDLVLPASFSCPEGFSEAGPNNECLSTEFAPLELYCPLGTIDLGDKCGIYSNPNISCPPGFYLEGKICSKTVFAAPLVEYTLTYTCTGKDCGHHHYGK